MALAASATMIKTLEIRVATITKTECDLARYASAV